MSRFAIRIEKSINGKRENRTICNSGEKILSAETGMCAIDFLYIDWREILTELKLLEETLNNSEYMSIFVRLHNPDRAPYYQYARWCNETRDKIARINPVFAETVFEWLKFETTKPQTEVFQGTRELYEEKIVEILNEKRTDAEAQEKIEEYQKQISVSGGPEIAAEMIENFIKYYPELPPYANFSIKVDDIQEFCDEDGCVNEKKMPLSCDVKDPKEKDKLYKAETVFNSIANNNDKLLVEFTQNAIGRIKNEIEKFPDYQTRLETLICTVLDNDNVKNVAAANEKIDNFSEIEDYQVFDDIKRGTGATMYVLGKQTAIYRYQYNPILLVVDEFDWMCHHRKRKVIKCKNCGKYFITMSPKKAYCDREMKTGNGTCSENWMEQKNKEYNQEIESLYKSKREGYRQEKEKKSSTTGPDGKKKLNEEYKKWKKIALQKKDLALGGKITYDDLYQILSRDNRKELIDECDRQQVDQKEKDYNEAKHCFEQALKEQDLS